MKRATLDSIIPSAFWTGAQLKALRKSRKVTLTRFWRGFGLDASTGSRYENGNEIPMPIQLLLQLAYGTEDEAERLHSQMRSWSAQR